MASYLTRFESMLERWQSRRKTIEISSAQLRHPIIEDSQREGKKKIDQMQEEDADKENQEIVDPITAYKLINETRHQLSIQKCTSTSTTKATGNLLYLANISLICGLILISPHTTGAHRNQSPASLIKSALTLGKDASVGRNLGLSFIEHMANTRPRWTLIPGDGVNPLGGNGGAGGSDRQPSRWERRTSAIQRLMNRISSRIGARNSIRVHNAFRDFAWQILSSLSMPTPVIYELRRQHIYSPEDDQFNDSLFNRNTSMTVRTKRMLRLNRKARRFSGGKSNSTMATTGPASRASNDDEDDDEPENLTDRLRLRLDDLVSLSRRSLFGRVIRVPSLFPFKRQEGDEDQELHKGVSAATRRRRLSRRRRKKDLDRQIIQINGKQYYVNDNGELKELETNETSE